MTFFQGTVQVRSFKLCRISVILSPLLNTTSIILVESLKILSLIATFWMLSHLNMCSSCSHNVFLGSLWHLICCCSFCAKRTLCPFACKKKHSDNFNKNWSLTCRNIYANASDFIKMWKSYSVGSWNYLSGAYPSDITLAAKRFTCNIWWLNTQTYLSNQGAA